MKKLIPASVVLFAVLVGLSPAEGYFDTGNSLYAACTDSDAVSVGLCLGTIVGHYDMMISAGYRCGSDATKTKQQLRDVVVKYLRDNPQIRDNTAADLSFLAFFTSFQCTGPSVGTKK